MSAATTHARYRPAGTGTALGGMLALAAGMGIGRFVYTPILPDMALALGLTKAAAGLIASANFVGYLLGALCAAVPHLPGGRRAWFVAAVATSAATTAAMAWPDGMPAFLLLRFAGGVASAFVLVLGSALVLDRLAAMGRLPLAALHFAGVGVGIAASAVLVDGLHAAGADWRLLWLAAGLLSLAALPASAWAVPDTTLAAAAAVAQAPNRLPPRLAVLALCHGLFGFGYVVTATFLVAVIRAAPQAHTFEPAVWVVVGLAAVPSTALWGRLAGRLGSLRVYGLACALEAVGVAIGGLSPTPLGALIAAILLGGTFMGITALGFAVAREIAPGQQRRSFALITAAFGFGQIIGPLAAGILLDRTGSFAPPSLLAAAAVGLAAIIAARLSTMA